MQSLPPLKPKQSWVRWYRARAASMIWRALATFFPREDPATQSGKRCQVNTYDSRMGYAVLGESSPVSRVLWIKSESLCAAHCALEPVPCLPLSYSSPYLGFSVFL